MFSPFLHIYPKRGIAQYNTHLNHLSSMNLLGKDLTSCKRVIWMKNNTKKPQN